MDFNSLQLYLQMYNVYKINANRRRRKLRRTMEELMRRRKRIKFVIAYLLRKQRRRRFKKSCWIQPELRLKNRGRFWEVTVPQYSNIRFQKNFRVSRNLFNHLCEILSPYIKKQDTRYRNAIPVRKRIAIALYVLKGNVDFWTIAKLFGVGHSTVGHLLYEFCEAIVLTDKTVTFPYNEEKRNEISRGFEERWQFPQCFGAMDSTHIPIKAPSSQWKEDYYNYKSFYSFIILAVVDHNYKFTYVNIGKPGLASDASLLRESKLFAHFQKNVTDLHIISDAAFPLMPWIMKPYQITNNMDLHKRNYNYRLTSARMCVENAFARLKGRWRILLNRSELKLENLKLVARACTVLHNLCEEYEEHFPQEWYEEVRNIENSYGEAPDEVMLDSTSSTTAKEKRDNLAKKLMEDEYSIVHL